MSIRKRGDVYQVRVAPFKAVTVALKGDADAIEADLKRRKALGHLYQAPATTVGFELDSLVAKKETIGGKGGPLSKHGVEHYRKAAKPWEPLRKLLVPGVKRHHVEAQYLARAAKVPVAAGNELQVMKQALRDAKSRGQIVDEEIFSIPSIVHRPAEGRALTVEELKVLAGAMPERLSRMVLFVGTVGLRFAEAAALSDSMVDLDGAVLQIPVMLNKSRVPKAVHLAKSEVSLLREQMEVRDPRSSKLLFPALSGEMYSKSGFYSVWVPARNKAGLPGFKFHWLRHTAASLMAQAGMSSGWAAERLGHNDGGTLFNKTYRHLYRSDVAQAVGLIDALMESARVASVNVGLETDTADAR